MGIGLSESDSTRREENFPSEPTFRVRKSDIITGLTVAGLTGLLTLFWNVTNQLSENLRLEVRNAENRILNRLQADEQWLQQCCQRKR